MRPCKREAETFSFLLSQLLRACLDDGPERVAEFASIFSIQVVDAPELRVLAICLVFHAGISSRPRETIVQ